MAAKVTKLRQVRQMLGWTQGELASHVIRAAEARGIRLGALGTLKGLICGWEQGKLTVSQTYRELLATVYGTTPEALGLAEVWSRNFPIVTWEEIRRGVHPNRGPSPRDPVIGGQLGVSFDRDGVA
ncbi:helix-turn-helix domain-containing protein [Saccharopolyspora spinosa]|uniref:HTH cro/C1-type domain-containing protein n=1 Tax=Saccharopolyspora spinosa TaxID=60894 RepID=A0A2N3XTE3_SACSN|nr:helix-turn-helix transcriptional regulator [Saccharopolyspora spinosa]PKW13912.1 hypothetical protein A8926_1481 [Saccharopolyspora spinosa]